ncbi:transcription repressor NadR [Clostridium tetani]|uniref:Transcriptional regulator n=1 Tax=Clostridium tetani (strain Massachusetts / E88) TaxID=212717 RepID=Q899T1_CLOTE|nr:transcription repressor NadR [Clostridium tetani]AAO34740.1 transcriptional regulator [Clostridium tetani E88]KGI37206.1 transcriptional regulator [Clostridium tetani]KGI41998.1 transcriptional regulator [Clostridium tetani]KGI43022.1 transcriptional regulator [Clostridium tetani]KHO38875.1 transcriptional regulator [Clostridium tetani]
MNYLDRRDYIQKTLMSSESAIKGQDFADKLGVTRQIIVKDIAILRASGADIVATPEGYIMNKKDKNLNFKIIALSHDRYEIEDELKTIVKYGGVIRDVIVEHQLYGEIKAVLMVKTIDDVEKFVKKFNEYKAEPLLKLTNGLHIHTILTETKEQMDNIIYELDKKGYLIK